MTVLCLAIRDIRAILGIRDIMNTRTQGYKDMHMTQGAIQRLCLQASLHRVIAQDITAYKAL